MQIVRLLSLLLLLLLLWCSGCRATITTPRPSWWSCVRDMPLYYVPPVPSDDPLMSPTPQWSTNPCGFEALSVQAVRAKVFFTGEGDENVAFAGDSTSLRAYVFAVNTFLPPLNIPVIQKVASVPPRLDNRAVSGDGADKRSVLMTFYNMRYVSIAEGPVRQAMEGVGGAFVVTVGNWDLNWKLQKNSPMPNLGGRVHDYRVAQRYWTTYSAKMIFALYQHMQRRLRANAERRQAGSAAPVKRIPLVVIREQFLLNCGASRFQGKKGVYRKCGPLLRPIVVPMYRRVLSALAWTLNIPVVRMDHVFRESYRYCGMGDGLHLQMNCMMTEQQHIWNAYLLLRRVNVTQGEEGWVRRALQLNETVREVQEEHFLKLAVEMLDEKQYENWMQRFSMVPPVVVDESHEGRSSSEPTPTKEAAVDVAEPTEPKMLEAALPDVVVDGSQSPLVVQYVIWTAPAIALALGICRYRRRRPNAALATV